MPTWSQARWACASAAANAPTAACATCAASLPLGSASDRLTTIICFMRLHGQQPQVCSPLRVRALPVERIRKPPLIKDLHRIGLIIYCVIAEGKILKEGDNDGFLFGSE